MPSFANVTATVRDSLGAVLPGVAVSFSSADPAIASVTMIAPNVCRVVGVSTGVTYVVATYGAITSNVCIVYVNTSPSTSPLPAVRVWVVPSVTVSAPGGAQSRTPLSAVRTRVTLDPTISTGGNVTPVAAVRSWVVPTPGVS